MFSIYFLATINQYHVYFYKIELLCKALSSKFTKGDVSSLSSSTPKRALQSRLFKIKELISKLLSDFKVLKSINVEIKIL